VITITNQYAIIPLKRGNFPGSPHEFTGTAGVASTYAKIEEKAGRYLARSVSSGIDEVAIMKVDTILQREESPIKVVNFKINP
jgi:hypothetical protein